MCMLDFDHTASALVARLSVKCQAKQVQLALAESCTGGMIAQVITAMAGSSQWFERGFVTYSNAAKTDCLQVPERLIAAHGAVSEAVAAAMAQGAINNSLADWSAAVTGVAGPGGGSDEKPVGTVWVAFAKKTAMGEGEAQATYRCGFAGNRTEVRQQTTLFVLNTWLKLLA